VRQKSRVEQKDIAGQKNIAWRKLGMYLCALTICLGIFVPKVEVAAAGNNQVKFSVSQTLEIKTTAPPEDEQQFTYVLEAMDSAHPLPQGREGNRYIFQLDGNQSIELGTLTFTEVGEYHYQLRLEEVKEDSAFTCDEEVYEITVYVTESAGSIRADAIALNQAGLKNDELRFTHSYERPDGTPPTDTPADGTPPTDTPADGTPPANTPSDGMPPANTPPGGNTDQTGGIGNQTGKIAPGAKTGDSAQMLLFVSVGAIALLSMFGVLAIRRKQGHEVVGEEHGKISRGETGLSKGRS
jgi:streptococcal pilin isopeptide linkage domain